MPDIKIVIDGEEVTLVPNGRSKKTYEKYKEPDEYSDLGVGESPLIVSVYLKPGWKPSKGLKG